VTVPSDGTVDVAFNVACVLAERIAFSSSGTITVIRTDGSAAQSITRGVAPAWSPNGARLAYECDQDICGINADATGFARLTFDAAGNRHPTWSPDGLKIAFAATHAGVADLYVMAASGASVVRLTQGVGFQGSPAWSPDGTKIAFDCRVDVGNDDICVVNADGTGFARLTSDPARDYGAAWKPDGTTLAFATTRYGVDQIVLMSAAGGSVTRIGPGLPGVAPTWSPDGAQLAVVQAVSDCYYPPCTPYNTIVAARVDGTGSRYVTAGDQPAWKPHP
jgi:Tol biopolymer transport system component